VSGRNQLFLPIQTLRLAITTAPIIATSSSTDAI
jgi:hypothetical protein